MIPVNYVMKNVKTLIIFTNLKLFYRMKHLFVLCLLFCSLFSTAQTDTTVNLTEVNVTSVRAKSSDPVSQIIIPVAQIKKYNQGQDIPAMLPIT